MIAVTKEVAAMRISSESARDARHRLALIRAAYIPRDESQPHARALTHVAPLLVLFL